MFNVGDGVWYVVCSPPGISDGQQIPMFEPIWNQYGLFYDLKIFDRPRVAEGTISDIMKHKSPYLRNSVCYSYLLKNSNGLSEWVSDTIIFALKHEAEQKAESLFLSDLEIQKQGIQTRIEEVEVLLKNYSRMLGDLGYLPQYFKLHSISNRNPLRLGEVTFKKAGEAFMKFQTLKQRVDTALANLYKNHPSLITRDVNERSITHKFAEEIQKLFINLDVDCEFNRIGEDQQTKKIRLQINRVSSDELHAVTVYPDIILHKRDSNQNILVIEVKKDGCSSDDIEYDFKKLRAFTSKPLQYHYGMFISLKNNSTQTAEAMHYFKNGESRTLQELSNT